MICLGCDDRGVAVDEVGLGRALADGRRAALVARCDLPEVQVMNDLLDAIQPHRRDPERFAAVAIEARERILRGELCRPPFAAARPSETDATTTPQPPAAPATFEVKPSPADPPSLPFGTQREDTEPVKQDDYYGAGIRYTYKRAHREKYTNDDHRRWLKVYAASYDPQRDSRGEDGVVSDSHETPEERRMRLPDRSE